MFVLCYVCPCHICIYSVIGKILAFLNAEAVYFSFFTYTFISTFLSVLIMLDFGSRFTLYKLMNEVIKCT